MRLNSLALRLFATSAAWTLLALPLAGYIIYSLYREDVQLSFDAQLRKLLTQITVDSMGTSGDVPVIPPNLYEPLFEVTQSGWYWQIRPIDGAPGRTLVSPSLATAVLPSPYERKFPTDKSGTRWMNVPGPTGSTIRILEFIDSPGHDPDKTKYSIVVAGPLDWFEATVKKFRTRLTSALALVGIGLLAATVFQVRFGLLPLRRIERGLASIRSGEVERLEGQLPAEIEPLQTELNALIESNQDIIERARTQVGNLAHALKTPLAVIVNEARDDRSKFGAKVAEQAQLMRDQISHYLDRARMAARAGAIGRVTPVDATVEPLVRAIERIHGEKGIEISFSVQPGVKFQGEKQDLEEMLGNLLDNACKWGKGHAYLTAALEAQTSSARRKKLKITIEDDGPGLSAEQRAKIGKRGLRLDETKPGSGLGLSIVSDLAVSYRGRLDLDASEHGGLKAILELPAA
ncbi:integral membrane sensor signal transduction histidine kinase [Hyphomicrobium denitrificans 1NES1]|uniref:histidine kinase n=1 Tax=Hyphomicrobium denitrificans 1NES1 TaxID=670307 RepID=N0B3J8_9HYPH|nr:sensor histidine kinase [Hyphomicrobium denitrificans]AGK58079.1 integral membrane sensor signal transduction histidine kinase [Hyphomicrobium denitrificans 1NES1]